MSRIKRNRAAGKKASRAQDRARQAADQVTEAAAQLKPLAKTTGAAAKRGMRKTRAWAAPQVERTGQVLQDSVAPKVSDLLSSAAQRLEPDKSQHRRWRKLAGVSLLTAAASAAAAVVLKRRKPEETTSATEADAEEQVTPAQEQRDEQGQRSH
jgi:hypothetical protein